MTAKELIAEARRLSGGDPTRALRLLALRMGRERVEDAPLRAAFERDLAQGRPWEWRLLAAGYAPVPDRPAVWRARHGSRIVAAEG
jgi:hypothetical protein